MGFIDKNRKTALENLNKFERNIGRFNAAQSQGYVESTPGGVSRTEYLQEATDPELELLESQLGTINRETTPQQEPQDEEGWFRRTDRKLYGLSQQAGERLVDVTRYLTQKAAEVILGSNAKERDNANQELLNIERIKGYKKGY